MGRGMDTRRASETIIARMLDLIERKGGPVRDLLRSIHVEQNLSRFLATGMRALDNEELRMLSSRALVMASNLQARLVGEPEFRPSDWRLLFHCMVGTRTLLEAITRSGEFFEAVGGRLGSLDLRFEGNQATVVLDGTQGADEELAFMVMLNAYTNFHEIFGWLIGAKLSGTVRLDFPERLRAIADADARPFRLILDAERSGMSFARSLLQRPNVRSSEIVESMSSLNFLFGAQSQDRATETAERARRTILFLLRNEGQLPSLDGLSARLQLGRMTLRRRLAEAGTSFQKMRDECRREVGLDLLCNTSMPVEVIAHRLDFCDSDALRKAMRSWVGMSPTDYRRQRLEERRLLPRT